MKHMAVENGDLENVYGLHRTNAGIKRVLGYSGKNLLDVQQGDIIIHLRGKGHLATFVGYSVAATDGHETLEHPPEAGKWNYATSYFRVLLKDYQEFKEPIKLDNVFSKYHEQLITYLENLPSTPTNRFFVYQSGRLQCLNGAYLSKCDEELLSFILSKWDEENNTLSSSTPSMLSTAEIWRKVRQRIGQHAFAEAVKKTIILNVVSQVVILMILNF